MRRLFFTLLLLFLAAACAGRGPAPEEKAAEVGPGAVGVGRVITLAGNGVAAKTEGSLLEASFDEPVEVAVDEEGNVYIVEYHGARVSKISTDGMVTTVVGDNPTGDVDGPKEKARLGTPRGIVIAGDGNIYISDWENRSIRRITPDGTVTTIAKPGFVETLALTPEGDIIASTGTAREQIIRITLDGDVSLVAGRPKQGGHRDGPAETALFTLVSGIAVDQNGQIYVTEAVSLRTRGGNQLIRVISPDGEVSTLSGQRFVTAYVDGPVEEARFHHPVDIEVDAAGNLYVADSLNHCIRRISPDGMVSTVAGKCGYAGYADGVGMEAQFNFPQGIALDAEGNIYVADTRNHRIRKIVFE